MGPGNQCKNHNNNKKKKLNKYKEQFTKKKQKIEKKNTYTTPGEREEEIRRGRERDQLTY